MSKRKKELNKLLTKRLAISSAEINQSKDAHVLYLKRTTVYEDSGQIQKALDDIEMAIKNAGGRKYIVEHSAADRIDTRLFLSYRAEPNIKLGNFDEALEGAEAFFENVESVSGAYPDSDALLSNGFSLKGKVAEKMGRYSESLNYYKKALEHREDNGIWLSVSGMFSQALDNSIRNRL